MKYELPVITEEEKVGKYKNRLGVRMFIFYSLLFCGFIAIIFYNPALMGIEIKGLNLAIVYGVGLIVLAILQALYYDHLCSKAENGLGESI
jgi:uncharacterized membrane protein (DUF485 family)